MDRKLRKRLEQGAELTAEEARRVAAAFSTKIPNAISVKSDGYGVSVVSDGTIAPAGRPNEFGLRHPVFGDREVWRATPHRPYLAVAEARTIDRVLEIAAGWLDDEAHDHGLG